MNGAVERAQPRELRPAPSAPALARWTPEQIDLIRRQVCPGADDGELGMFLEVCQHRRLDPFKGEIAGIMRWNGKARREELKIQVTAEGYRAMAQRTGLYAGQSEALWCGPDGQWRDIWLDPDTPPAAAKVEVYRADWAAPAIGKALYAEFVQLDKDGKPTPMWAKMPANQLAKCAERQAFIRAFKDELKALGIPTDDLTGPSRLSMEARAAGLDDDGRHALVTDVTAGRTDSSRDLTDAEMLEARGRVAALREQPPAAPAEPSGGDWYTANGWKDRAEHTAYRQDIARRVKAAPDGRRGAWKAWLEQQGIPTDGAAHTKDQAALVGSHILDILQPPAESSPARGVVDTLYEQVHARVAQLPDDLRELLVTDAEKAGIDPHQDIGQMTQEHVHWISQWLETNQPF